MWHKDRRGPRAVPCGTLESTLTASDSSASTTTFICLLVVKSHRDDRAVNTILFHLVEELPIRDCIKGLGEVEYYHIYLGTNVVLPKKVVDYCDNLRLTRVSRSEAMI